MSVCRKRRVSRRKYWDVRRFFQIVFDTLSAVKKVTFSQRSRKQGAQAAKIEFASARIPIPQRSFLQNHDRRELSRGVIITEMWDP